MSRGQVRRKTPSLGQEMHDRNRYKHSPPDFYALGKKYADFQAYLMQVDDVRQQASVNWSDPYAVRELTRTLLHNDFGLDWTIPIDRLCPSLTSRLNYIHWIEDLLSLASIQWNGNDQTIRGIDIGTGASCIYALLGAKMNGWHFIGTEVDAVSMASAHQNVLRNNLEHQIQILQASEDTLLDNVLPTDRMYQFVMCNPPFFDTEEEADTNPDKCCMGSKREMTCPGGDLAFIRKMIDESFKLQSTVVWFTSLVGRKASLRPLLALLREKQVPTMCTTEFMQGRTKRWGIAWSFRTNIRVHGMPKVLGKRKEAHRRQEVAFHVPDQNASATDGCKSMSEVVDRALAFAEEKNMVALTDAESDGNESIMRILRMCCIDSSTSSAKESAVAAQGRVDIMKAEGGGFSVIVHYGEGDRAAFWEVAEQLKANILRTGRRWRRKQQQKVAK